jgi:endoglucanase
MTAPDVPHAEPLADSPARPRRLFLGALLALGAGLLPSACITPPAHSGGAQDAALASGPTEPMTEIDAWPAAEQMGIGVNIGNTLDNTKTWETGWGNPPITEAYVQALAALGFKTVRLPVAWDTYAVNGRIQPDKLARVAQITDWITRAGMFCVINIHWDGGWIDSDDKKRFPDTFATFSAAAEKKYRTYWTQIAHYFAGKGEKVVFEALNEETNFERAGTPQQAYATLTRVNQLFVDIVRHSGGNNAKRLLIVTGYSTDFTKTSSPNYALPRDTLPHRLLLSVHYYTPWQFVGMTEDADWGKMSPTWGSPNDVAELTRLFDLMAEFCTAHDIPAFIGEFGVTTKKESESRVRWLSAVAQAARSRKMVPVLWDTGNDISRHPPFAATPEVARMLQSLK